MRWMVASCIRYFFFFKQKTAYEMRISDWSSDVCSSDLIMKAQIDHLPLAYKGLRPTQGRTLAVMQVCAGSQSFNTINTLRVLGRWMRMFTIPNQSSVAKAYEEFDEAGRMKPSAYYDRIVGVMESGRASCRERVCQY